MNSVWIITLSEFDIGGVLQYMSRILHHGEILAQSKVLLQIFGVNTFLEFSEG
jgi:hypothetical protein